MKIKTHHDDFAGDRYTVMLADDICMSFTHIARIGDCVVLRTDSASTTTLAGNAAERFLTEWQRVTGERVGLPMTAEEF